MQPRTLQFEDLGQVAREVERLRRDGYGRAGNWGLAQVCEHLALGMEVVLKGFPRRSSWFVRWLAGPVVRTWVFASGRFPAGLPMQAGTAPTDVPDEETAIRHLGEAMERFTRFEGPLAPHPAFGRLSRRQWERLNLIHCAHHLRFLLPRDGERAAAF